MLIVFFTFLIPPIALIVAYVVVKMNQRRRARKLTKWRKRYE